MAFWVYAGLAAYSMYSANAQAEAVEEQARIQRMIAEENAKLAEFDAWQAEAFGATQMARYQSDLDRVSADTRVTAAALGADITQGSLSEVVAEQRLTGQLNLIDIENQAFEQAQGYRRQATQYRQQGAAIATEASARASATRDAGLMQAAEIGVRAASGYSATKPSPERESFSSASTGSGVTTRSINQLMMP